MRYLPPVLTAIFCTISLYAANAERLSFGDIWIVMLISAAIGLLSAVIFSLNKWTSKNMPLIASIFTAAVLLWYVITPLAACIIVIGGLAVGIFVKKLPNLVKPLFVALSLAVLVSTGQAVFINANSQSDTTKTEITSTETRPNIYFIVPDRMPSIDAMKEIGLDVGNFKWELISKGFYFVDNQMSNDQYRAIDPQKVETTRTMRYFASVLNNGQEIPLNIPYKTAMQMIKNPEITSKLHELGYSFYNVGSWFTETKSINNADYNLQMKNQTSWEYVFTGEFNEAFWERTILRGLNFRAWMRSGSLNQTEALRHVWQAMTVTEISKTPGQKFVMAHLILPHEPYCWDADGKLQYESNDPVKEYLAQIQFTCGYLVSLVENIQSNDPGAIIIIQSDEGMAYRKPVELNYSLTPTQWNGVLSAWGIPNWVKPIDKAELDALKHIEILKYILEVVK